MENATKALLIAGGILLAVLILSVFVYMYATISNTSQRKQDTLQTEELASFNKQFESYNKDSMFGTDVITVMNKAMDNNQRYENEAGYTVQISVTILEDMYTVKYLYTFDTITGKWNSTPQTVVDVDNPKLEKGTEYTTSNSEDRKILQKLLSQSNVKSNEKEYSSDKKSYTTIETAFSVFKKGKFTCTDVQYHADTGRVSTMNFEQIEIGRKEI